MKENKANEKKLHTVLTNTKTSTVIVQHTHIHTQSPTQPHTHTRANFLTKIQIN